MPPTTDIQMQPACASGIVSSVLLGELDLRLTDCMVMMRETPDNAYDLAIVGPPYGINVGDNKSGMGRRKGDAKATYKMGDWDSAPPPDEYFAELRRVSKNQIIWGGNYMMENLRSTPCWVIWDKMQEFSGAVFEMAWTSFDSPAKAFRMSRVEAYANQDKFHPTQKPVKLYDWTLANYAKPGQRVLDTHMGSGSIAIAAHYAGVHLVACEIDADYYAAAMARIERETRQADFFSPLNEKGQL